MGSGYPSRETATKLLHLPLFYLFLSFSKIKPWQWKINQTRLIHTWSTEIHGRICHIWRPKLRGQFFKRTRQREDRDLYYVLVGFVYSAIFLPKRQNQITFRTMLKNFNMKNIKMRPPVPLFNLFKKSSMILYLFLKAKSQAKAYIIKTVVCCLRKRKDVKKTVKKKIGKSFLELTCFIFYLSFKPVLLRLCAFIACCLFFIYGLLEAVIEKCLLNSFLFSLSKILEKYQWKYLLLRKVLAVGLWLYWY